MNARWSPMPAAMFSIVLGMVGLGNDWRGAVPLWHVPGWIGELLMLLAGLIWTTLMAAYLGKWLYRTEEARAEVAHPVQCCFVSLAPISTMLMAIAVLPYSRPIAIAFFVVGAAGTLLFGVWRHGALWRGGRNVNTTTPVIYLPTVAGNFVTATVASALGWASWGGLFFGAGLFAWLASESVILQRLFNAEELPAPLRPTLGIQLAPPAVGLLALTSVIHDVPVLAATVLVGYAMLQSLLLLRLLPWIAQQAFGPGYWGFTFGLTALSLGTQRLAQRGDGMPFDALAQVFFAISNVATLGLFVASLATLVAGRFWPVPTPSASPTRN
jgi:tellurite resistance protein